jgi:hypothetical protein
MWLEHNRRCDYFPYVLGQTGAERSKALCAEASFQMGLDIAWSFAVLNRYIGISSIRNYRLEERSRNITTTYLDYRIGVAESEDGSTVRALEG